MEFSLFAHMEGLTSDQPHDVLRDEFLSLCKMADDGGMRAIWTGEHHGMEFTISPNPFLSLLDIPSHPQCLAGNRHDHRALLAPDPTGGRSSGRRSHDRGPDRTGHRPRCLFL